MLLKINETKDLIPLLIKKRWLWHIAFWCVYLGCQFPSYIYEGFKESAFWLSYDGFIMCMVYFNTFVLYPNFYLKKKIILYFVVGLISALLFNILAVFVIKNNFGEIEYIKRSSYTQLFVDAISLFVLLYFLASISKVCKDLFIVQFIEMERKTQQMSAELENLKAQLSPHFLFNTMNNFYGLAAKQSKQLPDLMLRLSDLMRYSLYGTKHELVKFSDEVDYLNNYIALEKIRLEKTLELELYNNITDTEKLLIAPLILIVFVENAFKHSRNNENNKIDIKIELSLIDAESLFLKIKNYHVPVKNQENNLIGGIGIENVKKRLNVIYPNGLYHLTFETINNYFYVELKIKLTHNT
jgi:two-component system, LytTR family, sensor histidine kinase LytS